MQLLLTSRGKEGGRSRFLLMLTDAYEIERVVELTVDAFGGVDVLVNAAGIIANGTVETTQLDDWDYMMNLNVRVPFYLMQRALPYLSARQGNVVNVSSVTGIRAFPGVLAYCVSKAGVSQMTSCTALELAGIGVRVNAVCPGVVVTELHRRGGMSADAYAAFLEHSKTTHPLGRVGAGGGGCGLNLLPGLTAGRMDNRSEHPDRWRTSPDMRSLGKVY